MFKIVEILGSSWGAASLVYDCLTGNVWWGWLVDAGFLVAGVITGGTLAFIRLAVKMGLRKMIKGLTRRAAIAL